MLGVCPSKSEFSNPQKIQPCNLSRFWFYSVMQCDACVLMNYHPSGWSWRVNTNVLEYEFSWKHLVAFHFLDWRNVIFPYFTSFAMTRCCHCLPRNQVLHLCATPPVVYLGDNYTNQMGLATFTVTTRVLNIWLYILTTRGCGYLYYTHMLTCWYSICLVVRKVKPDGISYMCGNDTRCHLQVIIWISKCFEFSIHFAAATKGLPVFFLLVPWSCATSRASNSRKSCHRQSSRGKPINLANIPLWGAWICPSFCQSI